MINVKNINAIPTYYYPIDYVIKNIYTNLNYPYNIDTVDVIYKNDNNNDYLVISSIETDINYPYTPSTTYSTVFYNNVKLFSYSYQNPINYYTTDEYAHCYNDSFTQFINDVLAMYKTANEYDVDINFIDAIIYDIIYQQFAHHIQHVQFNMWQNKSN